MEAMNPALPTEISAIPTFNEFKQKTEERISSLYESIFPPIPEEQQANYDLNLRKIYDLSLNNATDLQQNFNLNGLDDTTRTRLFSQLIKALHHPSTGDVNRTQMQNIVRFTTASGLNLSKIKEIFGKLDNTEIRFACLAMARAEALEQREPPSVTYLRQVIQSCNANNRLEQLKIINSMIDWFNYSDSRIEHIREIANEFQLNDNELIMLAKHLIKYQAGNLYKSGIISLITNEDARFQLAKFIARNAYHALDDQRTFIQMNLSAEHNLEILEMALELAGAYPILKLVSLTLQENPTSFDREELIKFIKKELEKDPTCMIRWPTSYYAMLPDEILLMLAKRGYPYARDALESKYKRMEDRPQEMYSPEFVAQALITNPDHLYIPPNLRDNSQLKAIEKILYASTHRTNLDMADNDVLFVMRQFPRIYKHLPENYRKDPSFIELALPLVKQGDLAVWGALPPEIQINPNNVRIAIQNNPAIYELLSEELQNNNEILEALKTKAEKGNLDALNWIHPQVLRDRESALKLIKMHVILYRNLSDELKKDSAFIQLVLEKVIEGDFEKWLLLPKEEQLKTENICKVIEKYPEFYVSSVMPTSKLYEKEILRALFYASPQAVEEFMNRENFKWVDAAIIFALGVLEADDYLKISDKVTDTSVEKRIIEILKKLPMELQMVYANRAAGLSQTIIPPPDVDWASRYCFYKFNS